MTMVKDKHSVLRDFSPNLSTWSLRSTLLTFLLPLMIHFKRNELFMAYTLVLFMILRAGFFINEIVSGSHLFYISPAMYNLLYFGNMWALLGSLFYQGIYFRQDISSIVIWSYLLVKIMFYTFEVHLSSKWGSNYDFAQWDLIGATVLLANLGLRDVSYPIVLVDFVKGMFWGAVLYYYMYCKESLEGQYSLSKCLFRLWEGGGIREGASSPPKSAPPSDADELRRHTDLLRRSRGIMPVLASFKPQMAPFKASATGVCSCEREDYECADPDDEFVDSDECDESSCESPQNKQHEL